MPAAKSAPSKSTSVRKTAHRKTVAAAPELTAAVAPVESAPVAAPASPAPAPADASRKPAKSRLVRDSFTMPQADFDLVAVLKQRALGFQRPAKKSELLRAGLHALNALSDKRLQTALDALQPLKPGRPKKGA